MTRLFSLKDAESPLKNHMAWILQSRSVSKKINQRNYSGGKMFKERLLEALKRSQTEQQPDQTLQTAATKIQKQRRLSSEEFQKGYDAIWKEGPKTVYQNPNAWRRTADVS